MHSLPKTPNYNENKTKLWEKIFEVKKETFDTRFKVVNRSKYTHRKKGKINDKKDKI